MKKVNFTLSLLFLFVFQFQLSVGQGGGMWPVHTLSQIQQDLKASGINLNAEDIFSNTKPAINDAVVLFGSGCTAELISPKGLLITNNHCGISIAQSLSTSDRNMLENGFWAKQMQQEIPCPGLKVSILRSTENVTSYILNGISDSLSIIDRNEIINKRINDYEVAYKKINGKKVVIKSFYEGNEYWANIYDDYNDIRLVAFPPLSIGNFGGDLDNWIWPRHTGDFAIFRVYTGQNNMPAQYAANNVPYNPKKYLPISTKGYKEGDISMVYGFPYITQQYISSYQLQQIKDIVYPIRISARGAKLKAMEKTTKDNELIRLKYAAKHSSISNGWKKWQGVLVGLDSSDVIKRKEQFERDFQKSAIIENKGAQDILAQLQALILGNNQTVLTYELLRETILAVEGISQNNLLDDVLQYYRNDTFTSAEMANELQKLKSPVLNFYKNFDLNTDINVFHELMFKYYNTLGKLDIPSGLNTFLHQSGGTLPGLSNNYYNNAIIVNQNKLFEILDRANPSDSFYIKKDIGYQIYHLVNEYLNVTLKPEMELYANRLDSLNRVYMAAQIRFNCSNKLLYPDANQTLRLSFGEIKGMTPIGGQTYSFQTNSSDLLLKFFNNQSDYDMPERLINLLRSGDYGRWGEKGVLPINFISQNHTSGGNSGSPVLNANGEMIGINFDRAWDGTMSDFYYDKRLSRNISVDMRYILFLIEKYGNAGWLLQEMELR